MGAPYAHAHLAPLVVEFDRDDVNRAEDAEGHHAREHLGESTHTQRAHARAAHESTHKAHESAW
eukprot:6208332-Prymnesium_polylepis.2